MHDPLPVTATAIATGDGNRDLRAAKPAIVDRPLELPAVAPAVVDTPLEPPAAARGPARLREWLGALDPRRSLAAKLGYAHVLAMLGVALLASVWISANTRSRIEESAGTTFQQYATQISNEIDSQLNGKVQWLATAALAFGYLTPAERSVRADSMLAEFRHRLPEFEWIALADPEGRLIASSGSLPVGTPVAHETWFRQGTRALWADDLNWAPDAQQPSASPPGFLRMSGPVHNLDGTLAGVIAVQLSLDWVRFYGNELVDSLRATRSLRVLVINKAGIVLFGPSELLGKPIGGPALPDASAAPNEPIGVDGAEPVPRLSAPAGHQMMTWPDRIRPDLAGWALSDGYGRFPGLGWVVWVSEPLQRAEGIIREQQGRALALIALFGLIVSVTGVIGTRRLTRRLAGIARSAEQITAGTSQDLVVPAGQDEAARIGRSLRALLDSVHARTRALEHLNEELDARVASRSREIERLADENRHAALMRERLRLARDLHDTLAQSLMSVLAEIRVLRKVAVNDPQSLEEELARAEQAAQDGLREARAAIVQLRHQSVRDTGLGPALEQLLWRASESTGLALSGRIDPALAELADSRAEVVYRIAEEALRNVQRHAHARAVLLELDRVTLERSRAARLRISDDGVGFDVDGSYPEHFGLQGMREQAELVGAQLNLASVAGEGSRVELILPL